SAAALRDAWVAMLVTDTCAFGRTAPVESRMVPMRRLRSDCAIAGDTKSTQAAIAINNFFIAGDHRQRSSRHNDRRVSTKQTWHGHEIQSRVACAARPFRLRNRIVTRVW